MKNYYKTMLAGIRLKSMLLLMIGLLTGLNVQAQEVATTELELGREYSGTMRDDAYLTYTATESGKLVFSGTGVMPTPYTDATFVTPLNDADYTINFVAGGKEMEMMVTEGTTYYFCIRNHVTSWSFTANMADASTITLVSTSPAANAVFPLGNGGFLSISFDTAIEIGTAMLQIGASTAEVKGTVYGKDISFDLKEELLSWLKNGIMKAGDTFTLTINDIKSAYNNEVLYNGDGKLVLSFIASNKPAEVASTNLPAEFRSFWALSGEEGIATITYDAELSTTDYPVAEITFGSPEVEGDYYMESIPVTVSGSTLTLDFRGKLRIPTDMVASGTDYGFMNLKINNIRSADGEYVYSDGQGTFGSFQHQFTYTQKAYNLTTEFTPASGTSLANVSSVELWLSTSEAVEFTGVNVSWKSAEGTYENITYTKEECNFTDEGADGATLTIPVTASMQTGTNVTFTLTDQVSTDGVERVIKAVYNEEIEFVPTEVLPANQSDIKDFSSITLTYPYAITVAEGVKAQVMTSDGRTEVTTASIAISEVSNTTAVITPDNAITEAGAYKVLVPAGAFTNESGESSEAVILNYSYTPATEAVLVFSPENGSTVESLKEIIVSFEGGCHPSWNGTATITNAAGETVATVEAGDYVPADKQADYDNYLWEAESTLLTLSTEITTPGTYTLNVPEGYFVCGADYENSKAATVTYTIAAPALNYASTSPESGSTVNVLEAVEIVFDETVSINAEVENPVTVTDRFGMNTFAEGSTLVPNKMSRGRAVNVMLSTPITENGVYVIKVAAGAITNAEGVSNKEITLMYEVAAELPEFTFSPENGSTVESLKEIIAYNEAGFNYSWSGTANVYDESGAVVTTVAEVVPFYPEEEADNWDYIPTQNTLVLADEITAPGTYTLNIPEGYFVCGTSYQNSPEITVTYTIEAPALNYASTSPESGSTVNVLEAVEIVFDETVSINAEVENPVTVTDRFGMNTFAEGSTLVPNKMSRGRAVNVMLSTPITENGVYVIKVAAGAITNAEGVSNKEITLMYEVAAELPEFTFSPENGSTVESLKEIIAYNEAGFNYSWSGTANVYDESGAVVTTVAEVVPFYPEEEADNWDYIPTQNTLVLADEITAPGTYTLNIPEGYFVCGTSYQNSPEITVTFIVANTTSIGNIFGAGTTSFDVYTVNGVCVMKNADNAQLKKLKPGIYVINGKKVIVRK